MPGTVFTGLSRRRFLWLTTCASGAAVVGSGAGLMGLRGCAPEVRGLLCLSAHEHRTARALFAALFPDDGVFPLGGSHVDLAAAFDAFLAEAPSYVQRDLKGALLLLEYGPLLFARRLVTFSGMSAEERFRHFESWSTSARDVQRQVATALRRFASLVFYDTPAVWAHIGYDGPMFRKVPR